MTTNSKNFHSFGALLTAFRKRKRLTQRQLAQRLGVHANTISSWELGSYLPATRGLVLELAHHLGLDESETRQLLEVSLTGLASYWLIPRPRNPFFTGREEILEVLHAQLHVDQEADLPQSSALRGLGGVGKTQIALEYAYRYALEYNAVFWIEAETAENIVSSLLRIAAVLQLPGQDDKDQQQVVAAVQRWFTTHGRWLLIWDNVENLHLLKRFLPSARQGAILLTTRLQALGTSALSVDLLPMEHEEGMIFLLRRTKVLTQHASRERLHQFAEQMPSHYAAAQELVQAMGGLPLALDQAGAYIEETQCGLPHYLELFHTQRAILLQQRGEGSHDHPASISTTFTLAITTTAQRHPAIRDLASICALLQPEAIPEELFRQGAEHLGAMLESVCHDELDWNQVIAMACSYSLLSRQPGEHTLSMHRLVQAVLLDIMTENERWQWTQRVINALDAVFPEVYPTTDHTFWKQCERFLPHALLCLHRASRVVESLALASLGYKVAQYLRERGRYAEAEPLYQRTLQIQEHVLGPDHLDVARTLNYLAVLYWYQSKHTEAEPLYQRTLQIRERAQGPDHPDVATSLNNLGALYWEQGRYAEAEPLYRRALHTLEQALGPDHSLVSQTLNNLALLLGDQEKYAEAEPLHWQTLSIQEQALGPDHPFLSKALNNLGFLFLNQGKYAEAEPLFQRALTIQEQRQEADHYEVATSLNGQGNLARDQGKYAEAEPLFQRALTIQEQHSGQHHPATAQVCYDLAILRQKQGNLSEALSLAARALSIRSESLGATHPRTATTRTLYAQLEQEHKERTDADTC